MASHIGRGPFDFAQDRQAPPLHRVIVGETLWLPENGRGQAPPLHRVIIGEAPVASHIGRGPFDFAQQASGGDQPRPYRVNDMKKPPFPQRHPTRLNDFDYAIPNIVVFVTACTRRGRKLFVQPDLNESIIRCFLEERERLGHSILAYCLMPDHYHLLCSPNQSGIPITQLIGGINSKITRLLWDCGYSGKLMQRSFYDHIVRREESLTEIIEYILNNPVRKGLVERAEDYPYSGTPDPLPL